MLGFMYPAAGLAIEQTGIRFISLKNRKTWEVRKKRYLPLPPGLIVENQVADSAALLERVRQWVKSEGLRGSRVALSIPPSQIIIRKMSIPSANPKQVEQLVKLEVETGLHLPFENPVYDYVTTDVDEENSHLLVFAAPRKPIQDYIDVLEGAGLRISSVEIAATALARSLTLGQQVVFEETMLINMEHAVLDVYMFRSGNPVFIRTINQVDLNGGYTSETSEASESEPEIDPAFAEEAAAASEVSGDALSPGQMVEITAEISRMLNFYQYSLHDGSTRIRNVLIAGSRNIRRQLYEELKQSLTELEISMIGLDHLSDGAVTDPELNDYRVAAGAALRGSGPLNINLLPREDREAALFPYLATALAGLWLVGAILTGTFYAMDKGSISDNAQQIQGAQDRSIMLQSELSKLNGTSGPLNREAAIKEILKYKMNIVSVLKELADGLPAGSALRTVNYTYRTSIDVSVRVSSMEEASVYLAKLRSMSFTVDAAIQKLTEGDTAAGTSGTASSSAGVYTAVYRVNMAKAPAAGNTGADSGSSAESGKGNGSGTDQ
ncbi:pilus assembly protein PilM [Paenibacillus sp. HN-1]|uniref:pilus assembly protein PilM n=1 Tax=Paenibacillus TaxID=44249 RepID=UPI001CA9B124|nr:MULTISPECIES: pilus assembly protein PilM [Paenibacillus]MBY9077574.1 pilus assembly protein PilM [Paenibacillus sp. CGMCC 1.18879]MBY9087845.1 pilus assembly protein PilM [Paenibacillus sinensis]